MTQESRETLLRAAGVLRGLMVSGDLSDAIANTLEATLIMIDEVLNKEKKVCASKRQVY